MLRQGSSSQGIFWVLRLKTVLDSEATLDTSQAKAPSMASRKGWRLDGVTTPNARVHRPVMRVNIRPPKWV